MSYRYGIECTKLLVTITNIELSLTNIHERGRREWRQL